MAAEALTAAAIVMAEVAAETLAVAVAVAAVRVRLVAEVIQAVVPGNTLALLLMVTAC